ncbi:hypothetical protein LI328DRAFT_140782 [Trichoderma asperelloides]|nr:hypothetical protein LI328DRAFT_140782 [Trichoderma asperelloides]
MGEQTGPRILHYLWSYVLETKPIQLIILITLKDYLDALLSVWKRTVPTIETKKGTWDVWKK